MPNKKLSKEQLEAQRHIAENRSWEGLDRTFSQPSKVQDWWNPLDVAGTTVSNIPSSIYNLGKGVVQTVSDPYGTAKALPSNLYRLGQGLWHNPVGTVTTAITEDPVGSYLMGEGALNLGRAAFRGPRAAPVQPKGSVYKPAPKPTLAQKIAAPSNITQKVVIDPVSKVVRTGVAVGKEAFKGRGASTKPVISAWEGPKIKTPGRPAVIGRKGALTPVAKQAIIDTGMSDAAQNAMLNDPNFHGIWHDLAKERGVTAATARHAALRASGVPEGIIDRSMAHAEAPPPGLADTAKGNWGKAQGFVGQGWLSNTPSGFAPGDIRTVGHEILSGEPSTLNPYTGPLSSTPNRAATAGRLTGEGLMSLGAYYLGGPWGAFAGPAAEVARNYFKKPEFTPAEVQSTFKAGAEPYTFQPPRPVPLGGALVNMGLSTLSANKSEPEDPNSIEIGGKTLRTGDIIPDDVDSLQGQQPTTGDGIVPQGQWRGGRTAYRKGGRIATGIEPLVQNLMTGYKRARKAEVATTKPLLHHSDQTIVRALRVAKKAI